MREQRTYRIRQLILEAVRYFDGAPSTVDDLALFAPLRSLMPTRDELVATVTDMVEHGYLAWYPGSDETCFRLSVAGRDQINLEGDRDIYIWGKMGL